MLGCRALGASEGGEKWPLPLECSFAFFLLALTSNGICKTHEKLATIVKSFILSGESMSSFGWLSSRSP